MWFPRKNDYASALPIVGTWLSHDMSSSDFLNITPYQVDDSQLLFTISLVAFSLCWLLPQLHKTFNSIWSKLFSFCFSTYNLHINLQSCMFSTDIEKNWKFIWNFKMSLIIKAILGRKNKAGKLHIANLQECRQSAPGLRTHTNHHDKWRVQK